MSLIGAEYTPSITLLAVPIFVSASEEVDLALERAAAAREAGAELVEWRVDALVEDPDGDAALARLVRESPLPVIVTARPVWEGGLFGGDEQTRISCFEKLATGKDLPRYLDIELAAWQSSANLRQKVLLAVGHADQVRPVETGLILSTHDFEGRPADLMQRIERMQQEPACRVIKVAWLARSLRDNLEAFDLLRERGGPTIALCMGQFGVMSRVLAPKFGGFVTFAALEDDSATAPGQPTLARLRDELRFGAVGPETRVYGVIGWPIEHSKSPGLHNGWFEREEIDAVYLPLPVPAEWEHFKATVGALVDHDGLDFSGASVTLPHKEHLVRFVAERGGVVDPLAELIGAANTLVVEPGGGVRCLNTDCPAATDVLEEALGRALDDAEVIVLGAGGVARAVIVGMADRGARVTVVNRTAERAAALADEFNGTPSPSGRTMRVSSADAASLSRRRADAIINCTSVGMTGGPAPDAMPLPDDALVDEHTTVFDTVYAPLRTPLLEWAEARGATTVGGWEMFLAQAALQFREWRGHDAGA